MTKTSENVRKISLTGLFIAISFLIPMVFHYFKIAGNIFLPMHIGIFLCGFFVDAKYGFICGILAPIISFLLTGMPPAFPVLPLMIVELSVYGFVTGFVYNKTKKIYLSLSLAMVLGRVAYTIAFLFMKRVLLLAVPDAIFITSTVIVGLPGIILQLLVLPILVKYINVGQRNNY